MPRKCSIAKCRSKYDATSKCAVYGFPLKNKDELWLWLAAIPNIIQKDSIMKYMGGL